MVSSVQKDWHVKGKNLSGIIHSSNKKSHNTLGLLPKSMDYIIEWNAPAPVYASQASMRLFSC